jgi:cell division protein FtsA
MTSRRIFALDIGTRKVMGLIAERRGDQLEVLESETREHSTRAMSAGEIQDISKVTQIVRQVAEALAQRSGETLRDVAVAVAGRNLRTVIGKSLTDCPKDRALEKRDIEQATFDALESALRQIGQDPGAERSQSQHSCVGYVVRRFLLDGVALAQPLGHQGERLEVEVLATFLPRQVLESQIAVLEAAGLEATSVTLEPIAALQASVSQDMRRLDLALVDIGAGTSDIALVSEGTVRAFGMVPCAGDSITEKICDDFLLDFNSAEKVKRALNGGGVIETLDIFQTPLRLKNRAVMNSISPAVADLAGRIAEGILELSRGKSPQAILCVGGGSLTPGLLGLLAQALEIPLQRVGVRSPGATNAFKDVHGGSLGPETATPLGIAEVASREGGVCFKKIFVNEQRFFLLASMAGRPMTALSALIAAGIAAKKIFGWPGSSKTYTVNGEFRILRARGGRAAHLELNGAPVDLDTPLSEGDRLNFTAAAGQDEVSGTVGEALGPLRHTLAVDGHSREVTIRVFANGRLVDPGEPLADRMRLTIEGTVLRDVLTPQERHQRRFLLNGRPAGLNALIQHGDRLETLAAPEQEPLPPNDLRPPRLEPAMTIRANGRRVTLEDPGRDTPIILVDALRHIPINAAAPAGKRLRLLLNGSDAQFTSPLHEGADVQVFFE